MDAVEGIATVAVQIERPRPERVVWPGRYKFWQARHPLAHFGRRPPLRPTLLGPNQHRAGPAKALTADTDAIAKGATGTKNQGERGSFRIDFDGPGGVRPAVIHVFAQ